MLRKTLKKKEKTCFLFICTKLHVMIQIGDLKYGAFQFRWTQKMIQHFFIVK